METHQATRPTTQTATDIEVTIAVVNWNRREYIREALIDLRRHQSPGVEVLVVDNGSTDGARELIETEFPDVRLIALPTNLGQCAGLNVALQQARGAIVVSLDNDALLGHGSVEPILAKFRSSPSLAILHGRMLDYDDRNEIWWWDWYGYDRAHYGDDEFATPWNICEGMSAMRRDAVLAVGGFPEDFFIMSAGRDLAIRLVDAGYDLRYTPDVTFLHKSSVERERVDRYRLHSDRRMYFKLRNELWTIWRHYPLGLAVWRTLLKCGAWGLLMSRQGSPDCFVRAVTDAFLGLPNVTRARRPVRRRTIRTVEYSRRRAFAQVNGLMRWYYAVPQASGPEPVQAHL